MLGERRCAVDCTGTLLDVTKDWISGKFRLTFEVNEDITKAIDSLSRCEKLALKAEKHREKRSNDANAFCWVLLHKIAAKVGMKAEDVYREFIKDFGVCEIIPIREDAISRWCAVWKSKGYGWITEDMGECRNIKGYHNIKCFYGSSSYNTAEMSSLIDAIVDECGELGIDTATPEEIERIKAAWQNG